jgi:hypothetical protein
MSPRKPYLRLVRVDTDTAADAVTAESASKEGLACGLLIIFSTLFIEVGALVALLTRL